MSTRSIGRRQSSGDTASAKGSHDDAEALLGRERRLAEIRRRHKEEADKAPSAQKPNAVDAFEQEADPNASVRADERAEMLYRHREILDRHYVDIESDDEPAGKESDDWLEF